MARRGVSEVRGTSLIRTTRHFVNNGDGAELAVKRTFDDARPLLGRPTLIVPGYGMNSFIFGFHPEGLSLEETLASAGLDVYSADLRGQGRSRWLNATHDKFGLAELAVHDLAKVVDNVRDTTNKDVDLIGCSLGTALAFAYLAHHTSAPVGSVIALGGLVTWVEVPTLLSIAFASPRLAGALEFRGTRAIARRALPLLARTVPGLLSIYINPRSTDLSRAEEMVQTVEDPSATINLEIAHWIKARELTVGGVNVSQALASMRYPLMCVVAKNDGIVPVRTARGVYDQIGSSDKELLVVGDAAQPIAHADLFLSRGAQDKVFMPIANFLLSRAR
jgi:alpha-beta hydrolase superfamily lysophospholipase